MRLTACLLAAAALAACAPVPTLGPRPLPAPLGEVPPPLDPSLPGAGAESAAPDPGRMAAACRSAAASQLSLSAGAIAVSPAERTSLGFVVFGQGSGARGAPMQFECSFGPDGRLRVIRAA